jgi:hypothetical protein
VPPLDKLRLAQDVLAEVDRADGQVPDVGAAFDERLDGDDADAYRTLRDELVDQLDRAATNAFSSSFLLSAGLALLALVPIGLARGSVSL